MTTEGGAADASAPPEPAPVVKNLVYRIETFRLVLRCFRLEDAPLRKDAVDASIIHLADGGVRWPKTPQPVDFHVAHARKCRGMFDLDQDQLFAVFDAREGRLLGEVGLMCRAGPGAREVGYWTRVDETRRGYTTEAVCALVRICFELQGVERVDLRCGVDNHASAGVARKVGFAFEGTLRHRRIRPELPPTDDLSFSMVRADFDASPASRAPMVAFDVLGRTLPWPAEGGAS